jgi:hypothetical protein
MAITQTISNLPQAPQSTDPTNFRTKADAFVSALNTFEDQLNLAIPQMNALETNVNNKEASATSSALACTSSANFQGTWTNQTTVVGQSWAYNGNIYRVLVAGNTSPSASPANWIIIYSPALRKNYLINGNFDKWDYGTSQTTGGYGSDNRWQNNNSGSTKTHSQVACGDTERALFNAMYFSRTVVSSVAGAGNFVHKLQDIENVNLLSGKTITLSFWAKADANKNIAVEFWQNFGTGGSPSASTTTSSQLVALTTTWQKKTITVTIPSIVGKTLGTDGVQTTNTGLTFWFDAGSNFTQTSSLGQQSGTFDIAQVKIEDGSVATNGWHPYDGEFDVLYANLVSPAITGTPTAPTATAGTNTTQLATTAMVHSAITNDLHVTGTAPMYACRAWVNFDGTGTVAIRASGNVSSITDNGVGDYAINFITAMPDANYAVTANRNGLANAHDINIGATMSTTSVEITMSIDQSSQYAASDYSIITCVIHR